ncbi:hypothetical protein [Nocardia terpenica]|uniref:hypothetical protein n=1 Tax=Nocardia terpenica TaxID=455432 RepID=UPI0002EDAEEA|nr:hypothetical protein [Nocardia terpenica]NQE89785.1 hypothetical protein [Nocardia terpenica]
MASRPSKPLTARRLSIKDFEEQALAALGQPPGYTLVLDDDAGEIHIPHPLLVADERLAEIEAVQTGSDLDRDTVTDPDTGAQHSIPATPAAIGGVAAEPTQVRLARAVLGRADHETFLAHGGKSAHVALAWEAMAAEVKAAAPKPSR